MPDPSALGLEVDGRQVEVADDGSSLLDVLREQLGLRSLKDGCSPQGQCGCCTVLVDGQPRVACVTPARRVRGRAITTLDGLAEGERAAWAEAFCATGASQCGFCTPGIVLRLQALRAKGTAPDDTRAVEQALLAHLCRCTGWRTILDAWRDHEPLPVPVAVPGSSSPPPSVASDADARRPPPDQNLEAGSQDLEGPRSRDRSADRDLDAAARRASIEGRTRQRVAPDVALGQGGFADDTAPPDALVAVPDGAGGWAVAETLATARAASGKVQGRRTTGEPIPPLDLPDGDWDAALRTTWVEPAYLELDASWCAPGGEPVAPLANGGAFGGKTASLVAGVARDIADRYGRAVRVVLSREDAVRMGPKRPPVAGGVRVDGTGVLRVVRTPGIAAAIHGVAPDLVVDEVDVPGPPTSVDLRAAGWAEASILLAAARAPRHEPAGPIETVSPEGAVVRAAAELGPEPVVRITVSCGAPLDHVVLRSYAIGAAHMALGWVCSEGLAVDADGVVHDLTIRSFGVLRAVDTPRIDVEVVDDGGPPVNGSDAVFAAVAAAVWIAQGQPADWPTGLRLRA
ncbi:MAG: 2Fe-2S iron-sulfur cluster-binding protein [Acidimicrobiales bacterium]